MRGRQGIGIVWLMRLMRRFRSAGRKEAFAEMTDWINGSYTAMSGGTTVWYLESQSQSVIC